MAAKRKRQSARKRRNAPEPSRYPDWIDIMVHPRSAFERIVRTRTVLSAIVVVTIAALASTTTVVVRVLPMVPNLPADLQINSEFFNSRFLLGLIPASVLLALVGLALATLVFTAVGSVLGGTGQMQSVLLATGWSSVPSIVGTALLVIASLIYTGAAPFRALSGILIFAATIGYYYPLVLLVVGLAVVHKFSWGSALLTIILPPLVVGGVMFLCMLCGPS